MAKTKAKSVERKESKRTPQAIAQEQKLLFTQKNLILFLAALAVIIVGHISLGLGSITLAPILLVLGYCVLVPVSIIV